MKILMPVIIMAFLCLISIASAITTADVPEIQESCNQFVDSQIEKIDVSVLRPECVIYNITVNSLSAIQVARIAGVRAFSNLTYYHNEVTKGWIGIFLGSEPTFLDIYSTDISLISDKRHVSESEALRVVNSMVNRGILDSIFERPVVSTSSNKPNYFSSSKASEKSSTSSYSSHSSDCEPVYVKGHYRNGKWVNPYYRSKPGCN